MLDKSLQKNLKATTTVTPGPFTRT